MCRAVIYAHGSQQKTVYFPQKDAKLPVRTRKGGCTLIPWGRRKDEPGILPMGSHIDLNVLQQGEWDEYLIKPVKLPILSFQQLDIEGNAQWFIVTAGQWVQGVLAELREERRVYIVTIIPNRPDRLYEYWPRLININV
jgi:hypothetical protein